MQDVADENRHQRIKSTHRKNGGGRRQNHKAERGMRPDETQPFEQIGKGRAHAGGRFLRRTRGMNHKKQRRGNHEGAAIKQETQLFPERADQETRRGRPDNLGQMNGLRVQGIGDQQLFFLYQQGNHRALRRKEKSGKSAQQGHQRADVP